MPLYRLLSALALLLVTVPLTAQPLFVINQSPFAAMVGLAPASSAQLGDAGEFSLRTNTIISSHFIDQSASAESVVFDGESVLVDLAASYVVNKDWRLDFRLPYKNHGGGHLDALIEGWHSALGLPDGGRDKVARNQLNFAYSRGDRVNTNLTTNSGGFGNIQVGVSRRVWQRDEQQASVRLVYSANRGEDFISADSSAWSASINYSNIEFIEGLPLGLDVRLGWLSTAQIRGLSRQKSGVWFTTLASQWQFAEHTALKFQFDAHGAITDSSLDALGNDAMMLSVGLSRQLGPQWNVEFAVTEDVAVETAADVSFLFAVKYQVR